MKICKQVTSRCILAIALSGIALPTWADIVSVDGIVLLDNGTTAVGGAMATITDANGHSTTAYTNEDGHFSLNEDNLTAPVILRIRAGAAYADDERELDVGENPTQTIALRKLEDPEEISERLTASAHAASIAWDNAHTKEDFVSQCHFCHQIGNEYTRAPRDEEDWLDTINRMETMGAMLTWQNEQDFSRTLAKEFDGEPVEAVRTLEMHTDLPKAIWREWSFGDGLNYVHDVEHGEDDLLYGADMSSDKIWILDREANTVEVVEWEPNDLPLGGLFAGAVAPLGTFDAYRGPHSIVRGPDGKLYTSNSLSAEIGIFDPDTRETEFVEIGGDAIYPHTLRFDDDGMLWFTLALSNQIGRMDIETKDITVIETPSNGFWRWMTDLGMPSLLTTASWMGKVDAHMWAPVQKISGHGREVFNLPYGIDISPIDGSVWYSKLYSGRIGRLDPQTYETTEWETPFPAPRRMRFDKDGILWIPSFEAGVLMKFDTKTESFVGDYKLPLLAPGEYETPYAVGVRPKDQSVWIAANMADRILRFDPVEETFSAYPSPTRVTFLRDFIFPSENEVCSSNANLPSASIEGGRPKLLCLELTDE